MSLTMWIALDPEGGDYEERCAELIVAETAEDTERFWRAKYGYSNDLDVACEVRRAEWAGAGPEPVVEVAGPWGGTTPDDPHAFRGYGFWEDGDPLCDGCGERTPAEGAVETTDEFTLCPECAEEGRKE